MWWWSDWLQRKTRILVSAAATEGTLVHTPIMQCSAEIVHAPFRPYRRYSASSAYINLCRAGVFPSRFHDLSL